MTEKTDVISIKAHQQISFPLLRRPRPPKPTRLNRTTSSNFSKREEPPPGSEERKCQSRPTSILPLPRLHPTPFTPHRHPSHPHTHTQHTSKHLVESTLTENEVSTDTPTTAANDFIIHSLFPRGPPFFPPGNMLSLECGCPPDPWWRAGGNLGHFAPSVPPAEECQFTLNDFLLDEEEAKTNLVPTKLQGSMISRQNYLKLTSWFATHVPQQDTLNTVALSVDRQAPEGRKPQHQILLELEALIKEALTTSNVSTEEECVQKKGTDQEHQRVQWPFPAPGDVVFQGSTSRYFCGQGRSDSPFDSSTQPLISPAEVAILESMMEGGHELSLKAHFLSSLPSLSPLSRTLSHLNLSFNDLTVFPLEVLELTGLVTLKMRNNPIRSIPDGISVLVKLETFCISFNLISQLPKGLFELSSLSELDISHNALQQLPNHIGKLRNLHKLNVEGNELVGLPPSLLSLPLSHLLVADNYMHPCLWRENCRNQPQALTDICCVKVSKYASLDDPDLPSPSKEILRHRRHPNGQCDLCKGPIFGSVLKVIKPATSEKFGQKNLPIVFTACSPTCRTQHKDLYPASL